MQDTKYTPGPWQEQGGYIYAIGSDKIAMILPEDKVFIGEDYANAKLISAAPELLEALEELAPEDSEPCPAHGKDTAWHRARAAIAKARGE